MRNCEEKNGGAVFVLKVKEYIQYLLSWLTVQHTEGFCDQSVVLCWNAPEHYRVQGGVSQVHALSSHIKS